MTILNPDLVEQQQLTASQIELLENLHLSMSRHKDTPLNEIDDIKAYVALIKEIEFAMQRLWGFDEDASYHNHWYLDPKCQCPVLDNRELQGMDRSIINLSCPLHGDLTETSVNIKK